MITANLPQERKRMAVREIIPGKLYQRGHFLTVSRSTKERIIQENRIDVVVNLWAKPDIEMDMNGVIYLYWPIRGNRPPEEQTLRLMLDMLQQLMQDKCVLVHCEAGKNRSIFLTTLLVARHFGYSGADAFRYVRERCPTAKMNAGLHEYVEKYQL